MGPPSWLQSFPIKLVCIAIHELPYLRLAVSFVQTETKLDRLICFSSYQPVATPNTNVTTMVSALIRKLWNMTSKLCWWGLPTLDHVQNAGAPVSTAKSKGDISWDDTSKGINNPSLCISQRYVTFTWSINARKHARKLQKILSPNTAESQRKTTRWCGTSTKTWKLTSE
jgi:hypothetical protein